MKNTFIKIPIIWNKVYIYPFVPNVSFLYYLKTSENRKVFCCFQGVEKGCIGNEWVKNLKFLADTRVLVIFGCYGSFAPANGIVLSIHYFF